MSSSTTLTRLRSQHVIPRGTRGERRRGEEEKEEEGEGD